MIYDTTRTATISRVQRAAEILEMKGAEGVHISLTVDMVHYILWLEDQGLVMDLRTGIAMKVEVTGFTASGKAVDHLLTPITDSEVEQTLDSLFSAGNDGELAPDGLLQAHIDAGHEDDFDPEADAYLAGAGDQAAGCYNPPRANIAAHDAYIRGQNDAWAKANKVEWWRRK